MLCIRRRHALQSFQPLGACGIASRARCFCAETCSTLNNPSSRAFIWCSSHVCVCVCARACVRVCMCMCMRCQPVHQSPEIEVTNWSLNAVILGLASAAKPLARAATQFGPEHGVINCAGRFLILGADKGCAPQDRAGARARGTRAGVLRRQRARCASLRAAEAASALRAHCLLATGGVLFCLFLLHGDLTISLQSGTPGYAAVYLSFYFAAAVLYVLLQRSDPGFLTTEEHHTLMENGEMRHMSKHRLHLPPRLLPALAPICVEHLVVNKRV